MPAPWRGMRSAEVVELLGRVPVFSTLVQSDLERIAELPVPRGFEPGEVVFREGDASDTCYVVREGHARAIREHGDGRTITLATFGPGDIFGELAMFEDELRSATVEAIEPTSVVAVLGPGHAQADERTPRDLHAAGDRPRQAPARDQRAPVAPVLPDGPEPRRGRAARARRAGAGRGARPDGGRRRDAHAGGQDGPRPAPAARGDVLVTATQADLAQLAGSSRESASRFLAVLERAGVISQGRGRLVVHDPEALKQYVF